MNKMINRQRRSQAPPVSSEGPGVLSNRPPDPAVTGTVYAAQKLADGETLISGVADALAYDKTGKVETIIDWKSDIAPSATQVDHYRAQLKAYCESTGARSGMRVFMSIGKAVIERQAVLGRN